MGHQSARCAAADAFDLMRAQLVSFRFKERQ